jgi:hypothetical protein
VNDLGQTIGSSNTFGDRYLRQSVRRSLSDPFTNNTNVGTPDAAVEHRHRVQVRPSGEGLILEMGGYSTGTDVVFSGPLDFTDGNSKKCAGDGIG